LEGNGDVVAGPGDAGDFQIALPEERSGDEREQSGEWQEGEESLHKRDGEERWWGKEKG
jgi:hypothetical protein